MRQSHSIEPTPEEVLRTIHYLDPDAQENKTRLRQDPGFEGVVMLVLLLGGVIACFIAMLLHVTD